MVLFSYKCASVFRFRGQRTEEDRKKERLLRLHRQEERMDGIRT